MDTKQTSKAKAVTLLPGDVELYPRRVDDDTVEIVVLTESGEKHSVLCALRPATIAKAA